MEKSNSKFYFIIIIVLIFITVIVAILYSTDFLKNCHMTKMWLNFLRDVISWPVVI